VCVCESHNRCRLHKSCLANIFKSQQDAHGIFIRTIYYVVLILNPMGRIEDRQNLSELFIKSVLPMFSKVSSIVLILSSLTFSATPCNTLQHTATHCNTMRHTATHCNTMQHTATHCNTLKHTATHCTTFGWVAPLLL